MGDATLPIDRFDVRGLLPDLSRHEAKNVETNLQYSDYLSPEDALVSDENFLYFLFSTSFFSIYYCLVHGSPIGITFS